MEFYVIDEASFLLATQPTQAKAALKWIPLSAVVYWILHAQIFFQINLILKPKFCAEASFSLPLILLASAPHLAGVCGVDQVIGVIVRAALSVTHRGLPGPRGGGPHMTGQQILISPQQLWVAGELASSLARASSSGILL